MKTHRLSRALDLTEPAPEYVYVVMIVFPPKEGFGHSDFCGIIENNKDTVRSFNPQNWKLEGWMRRWKTRFGAGRWIIREKAACKALYPDREPSRYCIFPIRTKP